MQSPIKKLSALCLIYVAYTQVQWGLSQIFFGTRSSLFDEFLLALCLLATLPFLKDLSSKLMRSAAFLLLVVWASFGLLSAAVHQSFGLHTWLAMGYLVKSLPVLFTFLVLSPNDRPLFRTRLLEVLFITQLVSCLFALPQEALQFNNERVDFDLVTGLAGDANLAGVGFFFGLLALYSLLPGVITQRPSALTEWLLANVVRRRILVYLFLLCVAASGSKLTWLVTLTAIIPLELIFGWKLSKNLRPALFRGLVRTAAFVLMFEAHVFLHHYGGFKNLSDLAHAIADFSTAGIQRDHAWQIEAQNSGKGGDGSLFVRYEFAHDFWKTRSQSRWLGLGPGTTLFSSLDGKLTPPRNPEFKSYIYNERNSTLGGFFALEAATWLIEWGPIATVLFMLIVIGSGLAALLQGRFFEAGVLATGLSQALVHDYLFGFMVGPLALFAIGQIQWLKSRPPALAHSAAPRLDQPPTTPPIRATQVSASSGTY